MNNWWLLAAIPVFGLIVLVHELGHFITAKWAGIRVEEFGIGFPPRLFGVKRGETIYSLNLLPIGGFVRMTGENGEVATDQNEERAQSDRALNPLSLGGSVRRPGPSNETTAQPARYDPRSFAAKPASKRLVVLLAGVTMNVVLAIVLLTVAEAIGAPNADLAPAVIGQVSAGSPAAQAGIQPGDRILSVNGQPVNDFAAFRAAVSAVTDTTPAGTTTVPITVVVLHKNASQPVTLTVQALAHPDSTQGHFGVLADVSAAPYQRVPIWQAPIVAFQDIGRIVTLTVTGIQEIVHGQIPLNHAVTGPVGIVKDTGDAASSIATIGPYEILFFTAFLSLNLAFINALPIPALDGGRVLLVLIEVLRRGKRLSPEREGLINLVGMGLLLLLMLVVTINDISNIVH
jgi:regulator of sigma E protease